MSNTCNFILLRGDRKGEQCSLSCSQSELCSRHAKMRSRPHYLDVLYADLIWVLSGFLEPLDLWSISIINKNYNTIMAGSRFSFIWNKAIEHIRSLYPIPLMISLSKERIFSLLSFIGCEMCGRQRIRKIHWEFRARVCQKCLEKITISDYRLEHDYNINPEPLECLPSTSRTLWAHRVGSYSLTFYLIKDVEDMLGETLNSIRVEKNRKLRVIDDLLASFYAFIRKTFSSISVAKSCRSYRRLVEQIKNGSIESIDEIELNHMDELLDQYDELHTLRKLKAKERRDEKKHVNAILEELAVAETIEDIMEIEITTENSETSNALKLRLLDEINLLNKEDETFDGKIRMILQIPTIKHMNEQDKRKIVSAANRKINPPPIHEPKMKIRREINESEVYCGICKTDRLFKMFGLEQHSHALHRGQIIALEKLK